MLRATLTAARAINISSVAYAEEDRASEAKIANALGLFSLSFCASEDNKGLPIRNLFSCRSDTNGPPVKVDIIYGRIIP